MKLRPAVLLVASFLINAACLSRTPSPRTSAAYSESRSAQSDAVDNLMTWHRPLCALQPPPPIEGTSLLEIVLRTNRVVYEIAVLSQEEHQNYPPPHPCYVEGIEGTTATVFFRVNNPRAISIMTIVPSEGGQGHIIPGLVVLPQLITMDRRSLLTHVNCWSYDDMAVCEHLVVPSVNATN
jgi:hypothetical protein